MDSSEWSQIDVMVISKPKDTISNSDQWLSLFQTVSGCQWTGSWMGNVIEIQVSHRLIFNSSDWWLGRGAAELPHQFFRKYRLPLHNYLSLKVNTRRLHCKVQHSFTNLSIYLKALYEFLQWYFTQLATTLHGIFAELNKPLYNLHRDENVRRVPPLSAFTVRLPHTVYHQLIPCHASHSPPGYGWILYKSPPSDSLSDQNQLERPGRNHSRSGNLG